MATAIYHWTRGKYKTKHVRLIMTREEHTDMLVAMQLACAQLCTSSERQELAYLDRLRKLYDFTWKPEDAA